MLNSAGNRLVHFIFTNSHVQPSYNESRGEEVMLEGLVLLPPRRNDAGCSWWMAACLDARQTKILSPRGIICVTLL